MHLYNRGTSGSTSGTLDSCTYKDITYKVIRYNKGT